MSKPSRPAYGGVPARAVAEVAARRQRAEDVQAVAPPLPAPPQPTSPLTVEARLKAVEKALVRLEAKVDLVLDVLGAGEAAASDTDVPPRTAKSKTKR